MTVLQFPSNLGEIAIQPFNYEGIAPNAPNLAWKAYGMHLLKFHPSFCHDTTDFMI